MANWNGGSLAVESAVSILNQTIRPSLWVVDNGSIDGSADAIQGISSAIHMIRNETNLGYAAANNQILRMSTDAEYILLVNNDIILPDPDSLAKVADYLDSRPEVKGVCGRYEFALGGFQACHRQLPTTFVMSVVWGFGRHLPGLIRSQSIADYFLQDSDFTKPFTLERPSFSCVLLRCDCALAIGLMDEQFPIFFNDDDYCWRWRKQGWNWLYLPDWRIIHHHNSGTSKMGDLAWVEGFVSAVRFAKRPASEPTVSLPFRINCTPAVLARVTALVSPIALPPCAVNVPALIAVGPE